VKTIPRGNWEGQMMEFTHFLMLVSCFKDPLLFSFEGHTHTFFTEFLSWCLQLPF
jgi:hypothetical protein